jgi:hypothetical protein
MLLYKRVLHGINSLPPARRPSLPASLSFCVGAGVSTLQIKDAS